MRRSSEGAGFRHGDFVEMVVGGFAVLKQEAGYKIVNLNFGNVVVVSDKFKVLESSMDEIEETVAVRNLVDNLEFAAA